MTSLPGETHASAATQPLVVRTVALDAPDDLLALLPEDAPLTWVRRGEGLVGWGEAARIEVDGPERFAEAERAWHALVAHAVVRDEVGVPGTGPVAFGSFAFDDESSAGVATRPGSPSRRPVARSAPPRTGRWWPGTSPA
jgi:menaquinone-specific isochorismate synthase